MSVFASLKVRVFVVAWMFYALFFATNIVREHYPAFTIVDKASFRVDPYEGFHPDIFRHTDGHCYIGNQVFGSVIAAVPLFIFDPTLDFVERLDRERPPAAKAAPFASEYPNRRAFLEKVRARGLELRFGAAAVVTSWFLMGPLTALLVVAILHWLLGRGVDPRRATILCFLFAFGTPFFYRAAHLNHNVFLAAAVMQAFVLVAGIDVAARRAAKGRLVSAGLLAGVAIALDYAGVIPAVALGVFHLLRRSKSVGISRAIGDGFLFFLGSVPALAFLLASQWSMYGDPFLIGQRVMPPVNYTDQGFVGFSTPSLDVFWKNLASPDYGLFFFAPFLLLAFLPQGRPTTGMTILTPAEARFAVLFTLGLLLFCAANRYSLMQWNSGFRYLLPIVPFLFLLACGRLARMPERWLLALAIPSILHQSVLAMMRFTPVDFQDLRSSVGESWMRFLSEGPALPALKVVSQAMPGKQWLGSPWVATLLIAAVTGVAALLWRRGTSTKA